MESAGGANAAQISNLQTKHEADLFNLGYPGFRLALSDFIGDLGQPGSEPASVRKAFQKIRLLTGQQFDQTKQAIPGAVEYDATRMGFRGGVGAEDAATKEALFSLESRRLAQGQLLDQQETDTAMKVRDFDLAQISGMTAGAMGSARGFTANALNAAGYRTGNPWGGAISGAASGAALGSQVAPGYGTLFGAIAGGIGGYFSAGG